MNLSTWVSSNIGKGDSVNNPLNPSPPNILFGECVYGASSYVVSQGLPQLIGDTAWDIYSNFNVGDSYQRINAPVNPQVGDVVFFKPNQNFPDIQTTSAGHVNVCTTDFNGSTFQAADINWNSYPNLQLINHSLSAIAGVFRPIKGGNMNNARIQDIQKIAFCMEGIDPAWPNLQNWVGMPLQTVLDQWWSYPNTNLYLTKVTEALNGTGVTLSTATSQQLIDELSKRLGI